MSDSSSLNRRQFFKYFWYRLTKSSEVQFSSAQLMRIDQLLSYDYSVVKNLVPGWSGKGEKIWQDNKVIVRGAGSARQRTWHLTDTERRFLQEIDGQQSIDAIVAKVSAGGKPDKRELCLAILMKFLEAELIELKTTTRTGT